jgi:hypothetical protein
MALLAVIGHGSVREQTSPRVTFPSPTKDPEVRMQSFSPQEMARVRRIAGFLRDENALSARVVLGRTTFTVWADGRVTADAVRREDTFHSATTHGYHLTITGPDTDPETIYDARLPA